VAQYPDGWDDEDVARAEFAYAFLPLVY